MRRWNCPSNGSFEVPIVVKPRVRFSNTRFQSGLYLKTSSLSKVTVSLPRSMCIGVLFKGCPSATRCAVVRKRTTLRGNGSQRLSLGVSAFARSLRLVLHDSACGLSSWLLIGDRYSFTLLATWWEPVFGEEIVS
jgi:hypothetical protein